MPDRLRVIAVNRTGRTAVPGWGRSAVVLSLVHRNCSAERTGFATAEKRSRIQPFC